MPLSPPSPPTTPPAKPPVTVQSCFKPIPRPAHADPLGALFGTDLLNPEGNPAAPSVLDGQIVGLYFSVWFSMITMF